MPPKRAKFEKKPQNGYFKTVGLVGLFALLAWLVINSFASPRSVVKTEASPEEIALMRYIRKNGGKFDFTIGRACPTCIRGAIATRDIRKDEELLTIPLSLAIPLQRLGYQGFPSQYAYQLAIDIYSDPAFNATHGIFLATQPGPDEFLAPELLTKAQVEALQTPELADILEVHQEITDAVYYGNLTWGDMPSLESKLGSVTPSLETFRHLSAIVGSRDFAVTIDEKDQEENGPKYYLVPIADMVNDHINPNAFRHDDGVYLRMSALENIRAGDAITNSYQPHVIHRPDISMYIYGFFYETSEDGSMMCAVDLPTYKKEDPFGHTQDHDSFFYGPNGTHKTQAELERLTAALNAMNTTEAEDVELLQGGMLQDWRDEVVVKFRLARKRSLKRAIHQITEALKNGQGTPEKVQKEEL